MTELKNNMDANNNQEPSTNNTNMEDGTMTKNSGNGNGTPVIYTPEWIAQTLGVKVSFVNRELREGKMTGFKVGKSWRITQDAFSDYCNNRINSTDGKRSVKESTKAKIRFHANVRHMKDLPDAVEVMTRNINKMKGELPGLDTYEKLSKLMKMKALVLTKAEKEKRLVNKDEHLGTLANKAFPGMLDLVERDPDELEAQFLKPEKEQAGRKAAPVGLAAANNA